jgi:C-terminal processing protease CtpA/Prc
MKKIILLLLIFSIQNGFTQNQLTEVQKMAATCKVWGFLKYYHSNVANGNTNWDNQLFDVLPKIEKAKTQGEFSSVIKNWIASLGQVKRYNSSAGNNSDKYFYKNLDFTWIQNSKLYSKDISKQLNFIQNNRYQGTPFYIKSNELAGNIEIANEVEYPDFKWDDKKLRLLALFRYWNYIEYFFPYKYQMDQKWDVTLEEMLPKFIDTKTKLDFHLAISELIVRINDSHAYLSSNTFFSHLGSRFFPAKFEIIDNKVVISGFLNDSLSKVNDIKIGDIITKADGKTISEIMYAKGKYVCASNLSHFLKSFDLLMFAGNTESINIEYTRDGKNSNKIINRYPYQALKIKFRETEKWKIKENNIGYVNMDGISVEDVPDMMKTLKDTKAIIFDVRYRPHDVNLEISKYLNSKPKAFAKMLSPDITYPGRFVWKQPEICGENNKDYYKGKVIILANEDAISHSEWTIMCLQTADKATIIGSQTAGADGNVSSFEIIKGLATAFSGLGVFYPDGKETQRVGIVPNIEVKPTISGIQQGKDEVLDRALQFIETGK